MLVGVCFVYGHYPVPGKIVAHLVRAWMGTWKMCDFLRMFFLVKSIQGIQEGLRGVYKYTCEGYIDGRGYTFLVSSGEI
jgi:hypothetical protein